MLCQQHGHNKLQQTCGSRTDSRQRGAGTFCREPFFEASLSKVEVGAAVIAVSRSKELLDVKSVQVCKFATPWGRSELCFQSKAQESLEERVRQLPAQCRTRSMGGKEAPCPDGQRCWPLLLSQHTPVSCLSCCSHSRAAAATLLGAPGVG